MQIDIPVHIEKLLFLHDVVVIPGLGGFTATKGSAATDYVGGTVTAPTKTLTFSENLVMDDGRLVSAIATSQGISSEAARNALQSFVEQIQIQLNQREIVTLPGIGRLYKNYVQKIQFLPDTTNFNAASYGLPPLQFSPIARAREVTETSTSSYTAAPAAAETANPPVPAPQAPTPYLPITPPTPERGSGWAGIAIGVVFLLAAIAAGLWYWQKHKKADAIARQEALEQLSAPTSQEKKTQEKSTVNTAPVSAVRDSAPAPAKNQQTTPVSPAKTGKRCILVVATLKEKTNADRLMRMLKEERFDVYYLQKNGYQVGIQFNYNNVREIQDRIAVLQSLTGEQNIWIKQR